MEKCEKITGFCQYYYRILPLGRGAANLYPLEASFVPVSGYGVDVANKAFSGTMAP
ncbi:MAG: hypothetical protein IPL32_11155 [Chloracidobacterium sp.]|nr:hypothetical protein [Chloracidobacterium sp.]